MKTCAPLMYRIWYPKIIIVVISRLAFRQLQWKRRFFHNLFMHSITVSQMTIHDWIIRVIARKWYSCSYAKHFTFLLLPSCHYTYMQFIVYVKYPCRVEISLQKPRNTHISPQKSSRMYLSKQVGFDVKLQEGREK